MSSISNLYILLLADALSPQLLESFPITVAASLQLQAWRTIYNYKPHVSAYSDVKIPLDIFNVLLPHLPPINWSSYGICSVADLYDVVSLERWRTCVGRIIFLYTFSSGSLVSDIS